MRLAGDPASPGSPVGYCEPTPALARGMKPESVKPGCRNTSHSKRYFNVTEFVPSGRSCCLMSAFVPPTVQTYTDPPLCAPSLPALTSNGRLTFTFKTGLIFFLNIHYHIQIFQSCFLFVHI